MTDDDNVNNKQHATSDDDYEFQKKPVASLNTEVSKTLPQTSRWGRMISLRDLQARGHRFMDNFVFVFVVAAVICYIAVFRYVLLTALCNKSLKSCIM